MKLRAARLCSVLLLSVCMAGPVSSRIAKAPQTEVPPAPVQTPSSVKPALPLFPASALSVDQEACATLAFRAAAVGDWARMRSGLLCAKDESLRRALQWRIAAGDSNASLSELDAALALPGEWPRENAIREKAATALNLSTASPAQRVAWFERQRRLSADQQAAFALALRDARENARALTLARQALADSSLSVASGDALIAAFLPLLPREDVQNRIEALLWRGEFTRAAALSGAQDPQVRNLTATWTAITQFKSPTAYMTAPGAIQQHPGVMAAEVQRRRAQGDAAGAIQLAARIDPLKAPLDVREKIAQERRRNAAAALKAGDYGSAYDLVAVTGLESGENYADSEWMAGWLALRKLNKPAIARDHFKRMTERVSTPVSLARGFYWLGQAERASGQIAEANAAAQKASVYSYTFYGQLAGAHGARMSEANTQSIGVSDAALGDRAALQTMVRAMQWAGRANDAIAVRALAPSIGVSVDAPSDVSRLAAALRSYDQPGAAIRAAKTSARRGVFALDANYPLLAIKHRALAVGPEPALIMSIARQESEFDPRVVSPVGARGLMQVMPATAKTVAARIGEKHTLNRLTAEPDYNVLLGAAYLSQMLNEFDGSYVLAIAAYNAGPNRVKEWIAQYGDPRSRAVDSVDWIESIPFGETRNYVQRVLENVQVYRQRLNPSAGAMLVLDLERGGRA